MPVHARAPARRVVRGHDQVARRRGRDAEAEAPRSGRDDLDLARRAAAFGAGGRCEGRVGSFEDDRPPGRELRVEDGGERGVLALREARLFHDEGRALGPANVRRAPVRELAAGREAQVGELALVARLDHHARDVEEAEEPAHSRQPLPVEREERRRGKARRLEEPAHARRGERLGVSLHGAEPARDREPGQRLAGGEDAPTAPRAARRAQLSARRRSASSDGYGTCPSA